MEWSRVEWREVEGVGGGDNLYICGVLMLFMK